MFNPYYISIAIITGAYLAYKANFLLFSGSKIAVKNVRGYNLNPGIFGNSLTLKIDVDLVNNSDQSFAITPGVINIKDASGKHLTTATPPEVTFNLSGQNSYTLTGVNVEILHSEIGNIFNSFLHQTLVAEINLKVGGIPVSFEKPIKIQ